MKLAVKNLGPVSYAEVDISKDLLIFTGENNSGKTYLAYTVHAIFDPNTIGMDIYAGDNIPFDENGKYEVDLVEKYSEEYYLEYLLIEYLRKCVQQDLYLYFSVNKNFFHQTMLSFIGNGASLKPQKIIDMVYTRIEEGVIIEKQKGSSKLIFTNLIAEKAHLQKALMFSLREIGLQLLFNKTVMFPSVREGINLFNKELSIIKNKTFDTLLSHSEAQNLTQFLSSRFNKYPKAIRNSLSMAQNLDAQRIQTSAYTHLADELENLFLQGKISVNTEGDVLFKPFNSKQSLDIHMTSSTVKSLSLLTIYLRHIAQKNDFIIIDEPELNLHPDNQRKIARFIGRLINEGFKVLISTHSDYIVRELNNLIMLSHGFATKKEETQRLLKDYNYNENELIGSDKIGAYLFRVGMPVENIVVEDTGFNIATVDEEIRKLNQSSQDIYFTLFDE